MKVNIGPYKSHLTTHRIKCDYLELMYGDAWIDVKEDQYVWIDHLVAGILDGIDFCLKPINKFRNRKIKIKYHDYDTWSLDHTLSLIILPGLKQLKDTNHGYAHVDNEDLPTACLKDASGEERWEWVMDEMIWAFEEIANDYPGEEAFHSGESDVVWTKVDAHGNEDPEGKLLRLDKGPNYTFSIDMEAKKKYDDRIQRALILFGKYYRSLWD
jgi:hypothetical protein